MDLFWHDEYLCCDFCFHYIPPPPRAPVSVWCMLAGMDVGIPFTCSLLPFKAPAPPPSPAQRGVRAGCRRSTRCERNASLAGDTAGRGRVPKEETGRVEGEREKKGRGNRQGQVEPELGRRSKQTFTNNFSLHSLRNTKQIILIKVEQRLIERNCSILWVWKMKYVDLVLAVVKS